MGVRAKNRDAIESMWNAESRMQRCRIGGAGLEVRSRVECRVAAECRGGGAEVQRCRGAEVQRC